MSSDTAEAKVPAFHRVFRVPNPWKYVVRPAAIMAATLVLIWIVAPGQASLVFALLAGVMLVGLGLGLWVNSQLRLEVSDSAIMFRGWGYRVSSRWDNLLGYSRRPMGVFTVDALIPRSPDVEFHPLVAGGLRLVRWRSLRGGPHGLGLAEPAWVGIPVGLFAENWRESDLGRIVQRYAPTAYETPV